MRRRLTAFLLMLPVFAGAARPVHGQETPPADSLRGPVDSLRVQNIMDAELDFARAAAEFGIRDAFLTFLAADAVVFTPRAINGRAFYADASSDAVLSWEPVLAETAGSDDLGYTTGPFTVYASPGGAAAGGGWYFSIWRRNEEGVWQVVLDLGTPTPTTPAVATGSVEVPTRDPAPAGDPADRQAQMLRLDDLVAAAAQRRSVRRALAPVLSLDARHNNGGEIVEGGAQVARALPNAPVAFHRLGDGISLDGAFGYTYGEYTDGELPLLEEPTGNWLRVWRIGLDGQWSIIQLVTAPIQR